MLYQCCSSITAFSPNPIPAKETEEGDGGLKERVEPVGLPASNTETATENSQKTAGASADTCTHPLLTTDQQAQTESHKPPQQT